jgi:hypothetical protein
VTTHAIKLTSPHELLAVVPYLLGFCPTNSIVTLCLSDNRLGLTQRLDLPPPDRAHDVASALLPILIRESPDSVILIGYEDQEGDSLLAVESLTAALRSSAIDIHDRIIVRGHRWRSLDCHNPSCCPPEGRPVPKPADVPGVIAEFVGRGVAPHLDRESLARQVEAGPQAAAVGKVIRSGEKAGDCPAVPRPELFAAWPRILDPDVPDIAPEDAVMAAMSLLDIEIRDGLVAWLCPGTLGLDEFSQDVQSLLSGLGEGRDIEDIDPTSTGAQNGIQARLIGLCAMLPDDLATPHCRFWPPLSGGVEMVLWPGLPWPVHCAVTPNTGWHCCLSGWSIWPSVL